jgi:hypothetical protein
MSSPSSGFEKEAKQETSMNHAGVTKIVSCIALVYCLVHVNLTMEEACSCDTSVDFQRTPRRYIAVERTFYLSDFSELINPEESLHVTRLVRT